MSRHLLSTKRRIGEVHFLSYTLRSGACRCVRQARYIIVLIVAACMKSGGVVNTVVLVDSYTVVEHVSVSSHVAVVSFHLDCFKCDANLRFRADWAARWHSLVGKPFGLRCHGNLLQQCFRQDAPIKISVHARSWLQVFLEFR